jgi:hypothetical protein
MSALGRPVGGFLMSHVRSPTMNVPVVLRSPGEVVAAIPALLGFHPNDSLVALWTYAGAGTLVCTVRLDLDTPSPEVTRRLLDLASKIDSGRFILAAYPDSLAAWIDSATEDRVLGIVEDIREAGVEVADLLLVVEGRYWSMLCTDPDCCPLGGTAVPSGTTVIEAELVKDGRPGVAKSRDEVLSRYELRPDLAPSDNDLAAAQARQPSRLAAACERALTVLRSSSVLTEAERADVTLLLQEVNVRDFALAHLAVDPPDRGAIEALVKIALGAPDDLRPRLAGAAAAVSYAVGDNPVGVWALLDLAGDDSLAQLVAAGIDACTPPMVLREVFAEALVEIQQRIRAEKGAVA